MYATPRPPYRSATRWTDQRVAWAGWAVTPRNEDGVMRDDTLVIDCGTCSEHGTKTCDDCVVTFLCGRDPEDAVVVDLAEFRAIRMLGDAGLVPPLRHTDSVRAEP